jgi:hypothetical protein
LRCYSDIVDFIRPVRLLLPRDPPHRAKHTMPAPPMALCSLDIIPRKGAASIKAISDLVSRTIKEEEIVIKEVFLGFMSGI